VRQRGGRQRPRPCRAACGRHGSASAVDLGARGRTGGTHTTRARSAYGQCLALREAESQRNTREPGTTVSYRAPGNTRDQVEAVLPQMARARARRACREACSALRLTRRAAT
jgi:hypothetical protein